MTASRTATPPLPRSLFMVIGSYHPHDTCKGCQRMAATAVAVARVCGAARGDYGDGVHAARVIRVYLPQPIAVAEPWDATDEAMTPRHTCGAKVWTSRIAARLECHACQVADYDDAEEESTGRRRR